jgi:hypothetical protein
MCVKKRVYGWPFLSVRPSVHFDNTIQLKDGWMDFDEICYGYYGIGVYSKIIFVRWMGHSPLGEAALTTATLRRLWGGAPREAVTLC